MALNNNLRQSCKVSTISCKIVLPKDNWSQLIEEQHEGCAMDLSYMRETGKNCGISLLFYISRVCLPHAKRNDPIIRPRNTFESNCNDLCKLKF